MSSGISIRSRQLLSFNSSLLTKRSCGGAGKNGNAQKLSRISLMRTCADRRIGKHGDTMMTMMRRRLRPALATTSPLISSNTSAGDSLSTRKVDFSKIHSMDAGGIKSLRNKNSSPIIQLPHLQFQRPALIASRCSKIQQDGFQLNPFRPSFLDINANATMKSPFSPNAHLLVCYSTRFPMQSIASTSTTTTRSSTLRRYFTSNKKGHYSKETGNQLKNDKAENSATEVEDATDKVSSFISLPNAPARTTAELAKIRQNFANYEQTIKRVVSRQDGSWNTSDLLSVYGIVALIVLIGTAPFVIRYVMLYCVYTSLLPASFSLLHLPSY